MPASTIFHNTRIDYEVDAESGFAQLDIADTRTNQRFRVVLPIHVFPVVLDAIRAMIADNRDCFPDVETSRIN